MERWLGPAANRHFGVSKSPPRREAPAQGRVVLVGGGPGDPDLLTVKAVKALRDAEVVVYDGLIAPRILELANPLAERICVAKARSRHTMRQEDINALLVAKARAGYRVARLKGGDPFVFGRGGEEVEACREAGIDVEVIPGITAALGCAAESLLPLTHRNHASAVTFVAGQCKGLSDQDWRGLAAPGRTLVIYMGLAAAPAIAAKLMEDGLAPDTPAAVLEGGTRLDARTFRTTLADLPGTLARHGVRSPALLVVGEVAALAVERPEALAPFVPENLDLLIPAE
ncbi:uroporphyrinogen-III C-methyltransferase [Pedomonas sp. V897]|uniref:uroporphyrinogen-III C-methyltransferase n=1 Tax=Pedomonas sp. V897 TaxID=3446482 RepID=UPI003EE1B01B